MTENNREIKTIVSRSRFFREDDLLSKTPFRARRAVAGQPAGVTDATLADIAGEESAETSKPSASPFRENAQIDSDVETGSSRVKIGVLYGFLGTIGMIILCGISYYLGKGSAPSPNQSIIVRASSMSPEISTKLDQALTELRQGNAQKAVDDLQELEKIEPAYSSLSYLVSLAALEKGDFDLATQKAEESLQKRERVSDSLALQAALEGQTGNHLKLASVDMRAESLLRQAILADPANPYPYFELGNLLRRARRTQEALAAIRAAELRLNPIDSHLTMPITRDLATLEVTPDDQLAERPISSGDPRDLFPAAYIAMRRGNFDAAASLLQQCRALLSPDVFYYLVHDPALRKFSAESSLSGFYSH
jgi:tetratricopeptide (TPR) repeat protein